MLQEELAFQYLESRIEEKRGFIEYLDHYLAGGNQMGLSMTVMNALRGRYPWYVDYIEDQIIKQQRAARLQQEKEVAEYQEQLNGRKG